MDFKAKFYTRLEALSRRDAFEFPLDALPPVHKKAAVLLPFWPNSSGGVELVLTKRPETMSSHAGQVSFPGGRMDEQDLTLEQAALRETYEELGIEQEQVKIMGRLDDAWSIAGHHVVPFVGWLERRPEITPNVHEVAEVLIADVEMLLLPETLCEHEVSKHGIIRTTHAFSWDEGYVWGLTADLLQEFLLWLKEEPASLGRRRLNYLRQAEHATADRAT